MEKHQTVFENEILTPEVLEKQLEDQKEAYLVVGLLEKNDDGKVGFEVDGRFYEFPSIDEVEDYLTENEESREFFEKKIGQGFTEIRISPFYSPLSGMIREINQKVYEAGGEDLALPDPWQQADIIKYKITFDPIKIDVNAESGQTKSQIIEEINKDSNSHPYILNGYIVSFVESNEEIPTLGDNESINSRKVMIENNSSIGYLKSFNDPQSVYFNESAIFVEEWLCMFGQKLYEKFIKKNEVISNNKVFDSTSRCFFVSNRFTHLRFPSFPTIAWDRDKEIINYSYEYIGPSFVLGPRPAVRRIA